MPRRARRHTLLSAAVLSVMTSDDQREWTVIDVADACQIQYGSAYPVLERLWSDGYLARLDRPGRVGQPRVFYELSEFGWEEARVLQSYMSDPVGALRAWVVRFERPPASPPGSEEAGMSPRALQR